MRKLYKLRECAFCGKLKETLAGLCDECANAWQNGTLDNMRENYEEPMFYECAMCGMEIVSYETVRGHKYCHSCAAIERNG